MTPLSRVLARRRRGAAELFGVIALVALAGAALTAWALAEHREQTAASGMTAGHVATAWLKAMHRATQETDWSAAVAAGGAVVTPASLSAAGHAPPGLPRALQRGTMALGVISDGTPEATAMAFLVIDPATPSETADIHAGLIEAGVEVVEHAAGPAGVMAPHRPAIEALVGTLAAGAFYATADTLAHVPNTLYRRPQPGRPQLNRMETDIELDGHDVDDAAALHAGAIDHLDPAINPADATTWPGVTLASTTVISTAGVVADPASLVPGTTAIDPTATSIGPGAANLEASSATFADLDGAFVEAAADLIVTGDLRAGTLAAQAALTSASADITRHLQAAVLRAAQLSAQETTVAGAVTVATTLQTQTATSATIAGSPTVGTRRVNATGGVYGPSLTITGHLTAGACNGC